MYIYISPPLSHPLSPLGGGLGKPSRRVAAQTILNASASLTPDVLFKTINAEHVIADTVFQAIINVVRTLTLQCIHSV